MTVTSKQRRATMSESRHLVLRAPLWAAVALVAAACASTVMDVQPGEWLHL
jgi:hypothetical protein